MRGYRRNTLYIKKNVRIWFSILLVLTLITAILPCGSVLAEEGQLLAGDQDSIGLSEGTGEVLLLTEGLGEPNTDDDPELGGADPEPGVTDPEPGVTDPEPGVTDPEPGVNDPEPGVTDPEPGVTDPEPGVTDPEPGVVDPEPGIVDPEPGVVDPEPGVVDPEPDITDPEPGIAEIVGEDRTIGCTANGRIRSGRF